MKVSRRWVLPILVGLGLLLSLLEGCSKRSHTPPPETPYRRAINALGGHKYDDARQALSEAMTEDRKDSRDSALVEDYLLLGYLDRQDGGYDSIEANLREAMSLAHTIGENHLEREAKLTLADFYNDAHLYYQADTQAASGATLGELLSDWKSVSAALIQLARARHGLTRYSSEERILDSLTRIDSTWLRNQSDSSNGSGGISGAIDAAKFTLYRDWGKPAEMRGAYDQWRGHALARRDTGALIEAFLNWGEAMQAVGQHDSAARAYAQALTLLNFLPDYHRQVRTFIDLGNLAFIGANYDNADRYYGEASQRAHDGGLLLAEQMLKLQMIASDWLQHKARAKDTTRLDQQCEQVRTASPVHGVHAVDAYAYFLRGRIQDLRNQPAAALRNYRLALDAFESDALLHDHEGRNAIEAGGEMRSLVETFMAADGSDWYDAPIALSCQVQDAAGAFELNERRNLADLQSFFTMLPFNSRSGEISAAANSLQQHYAMRLLMRSDLTEEYGAGAGRNDDRIQRVAAADSVLSHSVPLQGTENGAPASASPASLSTALRWLIAPGSLTMRQAQDSLRAGCALLEYLPTKTTFYTLVIKHDTAFIRSSSLSRERFVSLRDEYTHLVSLSDSMLQQSGVGETNRRIATVASILASSMLTPVQSLLSGVTKLYVAQTPEIGPLPVHTLQRGSTFAKYPIGYLPTAAALLWPAAPYHYVSNVAGFGVRGDAGWDVEYELKDIWAFYKEAKMFFDSSATAAQLRAMPYDVLHLCVEFSLNERAPGESHMTVADGKTAAGKEAFPLSAFYTIPPSQTILFSNVAGAPCAFYRYAPAILLANGSISVIGTMWQGDRKSKKYFGEVFYTSLLGSMASDEAYRQAMVKLSGNIEYESARQYGNYFYYGK